MRRRIALAVAAVIVVGEGIFLTRGPMTQEAPNAVVPPAAAQDAPATLAQLPAERPAAGAEVPGTAPSGASSVAVPAVDETALRYFARAGDTRRLEVEIARLRALYPDWTPPADPLAVPSIGDPELDALWTLYAENRFPELRAAIAERQAREPEWQVPADLLERLTVAEARQQLVNASNLQQFETVVRVAAEAPSLLTCSEVDVLWRLARAFAETDRAARSLDVYSYVLTNCDNSGERLATLQMANQRLDRAAVDRLLALEQTNTEGIGEFTSIRLDLARDAVAAGGAADGPDASAEDLARLTASVEETGAASDLLLLAWYALNHDAAERAQDYFRRSADAEPSPDAARGLALALLALDRPVEAEAAIRSFAEGSDEARRVYSAAAANLLGQQPPPALSNDQLTLMASVAATLQDPNTAQEFGWYSYNLNQFATAGQWFETSLGWKADEEPAAFGLALVRERLGDLTGLAQLKAVWGSTSPRIAAVGLPQAGVSAGAPVVITAITPVDASTTPIAGATPYLPPQAAARHPQPATPVVRQDNQAAPVQSRAPEQIMVAEQPQAAARVVEPRRDAQRAAPATVRTSPRSSSGGCRTTVDPRTLSPEAALPRAWCLMDLDRPLEAAPSFEVAMLSSSDATRREAAYGQSLAYLRAGLTDKAAVAATRAPQTRDRSLEIQIALLTTQAVAAFENERPVEALLALDERARLAPERLDLMVLRGFAYLDLRRFSDAEKVFSAAGRAGNRDAIRGLNLVREQRGGTAAGN